MLTTPRKASWRLFSKPFQCLYLRDCALGKGGESNVSSPGLHQVLVANDTLRSTVTLQSGATSRPLDKRSPDSCASHSGSHWVISLVPKCTWQLKQPSHLFLDLWDDDYSI